MGPWGPKGPMPPRGHFWALWGPKGPSGGTGGLRGEAPGAPRRLPGHFWKNPDFGLPAAGLAPAPSGLAAAPSGLAAAPNLGIRHCAQPHFGIRPQILGSYIVLNHIL